MGYKQIYTGTLGFVMGAVAVYVVFYDHPIGHIIETRTQIEDIISSISVIEPGMKINVSQMSYQYSPQLDTAVYGTDANDICSFQSHFGLFHALIGMGMVQYAQTTCPKMLLDRDPWQTGTASPPMTTRFQGEDL
jgi:hypothetical protein